MANTLSTYTAMDHTSDAGFRAWGAEFHASLVSIGLTLTSDTGQINWTTVTRPAITVSAGYEIWQFNDTLQSTTPIYIKVEYGTGGTATYPAIWITVGQGSNGTGTLTGLVSSRCSCGYSQVPLSTTLTYFSRFCYNATLGFFGFSWKSGLGVANVSYSSAFIFRSCDTTGAPTSATVQLLTNDNTTPSTGKFGVMQCLSYANNAIYPPVPATQGQWWAGHAYAQTITEVGANISLDPVFFMTPALGVTSCLSRAVFAECGINAVVTVALVGTTTYTYLSIGVPFSSASSGATGLDASSGSYSLTLLMLWA